MNQISIGVLFISLSFLFNTTNSETIEVKETLLNFLRQVSNTNGILDPKFGWNLSSDPCKNQWVGVSCDNRTLSVNKISLSGLNFSGTFNPYTLCSSQSLASSLSFFSINDNNLRSVDLHDVSKCRKLSHLYISRNQFSGPLPYSFSRLNNLIRLDISNNKFSGSLPDLARISCLTEFLAQNNELNGPIPHFDFANFDAFNVSFNNFSGPIPEGGNIFPISSYSNNPQLCGEPLQNACPPPVWSSVENHKKKLSNDQILINSGYFIIGLAVILIIILRFCKKPKSRDVITVDKKLAVIDDSSMNLKPSFASTDYKGELSKSVVSVESGAVSSSLIVLSSPEVNGLKFDELLKAPAEFVGRGKHGSVYKVICEERGLVVAVKRIKDWAMASDDFKKRMQRLDQVKHPNVLPAVAFYCSKQEKLLVYEYQPNGSLFKLLHGTQMGQKFEWSNRLGVAATIAESLAFMHQKLHEERIPHGNLKSSNILLNKNMDPIISEYGLMEEDNNNNGEHSSISTTLLSNLATEDHQIEAKFKTDVYGFGVILLELLTGKVSVVQNGMDLAKWVVYVVREEWTVEVFDKMLVREGASEERMVSLLQVAIKCVDRSTVARPSMAQVAMMIGEIKEDEERSMDV